MKHLLNILSIVFLCSCGSAYRMTTTTVDLSEYNRNGFTITTSSVSTEYKSLGLLSVDCTPGFVARQAKPEPKQKDDDIYSAPSVRLSGNYADCNKAELIDALYNQALSLKANAIIDLRFSDYVIKDSSGTTVHHTATGLAVYLK